MDCSPSRHEDVGLPRSVELSIKRIRDEKKQPPLRKYARQMLSDIGEQASVEILNTILASNAPISSFSGFVSHLVRKSNPLQHAAVLSACSPQSNSPYISPHKPNEVRVSNTFYVTRMIVNERIEETNSFRSSVLSSVNPTKSISCVTFPSTRTISEEISSGNFILRTIEQLYENGEVGGFWISATIVSMEDRWWYLSCMKCPKKLTPTSSNFYCEKCDQHYGSGNFRYKMQLHVVDDTGNAPLLLWDRECETLIGKSCSRLKAQLMENPERKAIPEEVASLLDRRVLFKVQVRADQVHNFGGAFTVIKLSMEDDLVARYSALQNESQESDFLSKLQNAELESCKACESKDEVITRDKSKKKCVVSLTDNASIKGNLFGDFSSTESVRKGKVVIKEEKE